MKKRARIVLLVILAVVFAGSLCMLVRDLLQYRAGDETYAEAEALAGLELPEAPPPAAASSAASSAASDAPAAPPADEPKPVYVDPYADALAAMDFTALQEANSDVLGWILIPGTAISYPLVQTTDNQYYLKHTWKKWNSIVGAIFLECTSSPDFSDFHTLIYGHRMNNGSMFAGLKYYKKQSYWRAHPTVYITDQTGTRTYEIFAAYEVSAQGTTYQVGFPSDASKQSFLDYCLGQSLYDTGVVPTVNDRILTLSTCTGNGHANRWVVQARLEGAPAETEAPTEAETPAEVPAESPAETEAPAEVPADAPTDDIAVNPPADGPADDPLPAYVAP